MDHKATPDFSALLKSLPPIVARNQIERYLGGLISRGYLENLDSEGKGPRRIKVRVTGSRGRVGYLREDLVRWLSERATFEGIKEKAE